MQVGDRVMELAPSILALISALFGGAALELIKTFVSRKAVKDKTASDLRAELRDEVRYLREELKQAEEEKERLRENYYRLRDDFSEIKNDLDQALQRLKDQAEEAQAIVHEIKDT